MASLYITLARRNVRPPGLVAGLLVGCREALSSCGEGKRRDFREFLVTFVVSPLGFRLGLVSPVQLRQQVPCKLSGPRTLYQRTTHIARNGRPEERMYRESTGKKQLAADIAASSLQRISTQVIVFSCLQTGDSFQMLVLK